MLDDADASTYIPLGLGAGTILGLVVESVAGAEGMAIGLGMILGVGAGGLASLLDGNDAGYVALGIGTLSPAGWVIGSTVGAAILGIFVGLAAGLLVGALAAHLFGSDPEDDADEDGGGPATETDAGAL